jgi:hypothetical protein
MDALEQVGSFLGYRDNNKNNIFDTESKIILPAKCKINLHGSGINDSDTETIGRYSAACQVLNKSTDNTKLIAWVKEDFKRNNALFSYTLIDETDLNVFLSQQTPVAVEKPIEPIILNTPNINLKKVNILDLVVLGIRFLLRF